jgi:TetR/AcrR family transcriptional regulator
MTAESPPPGRRERNKRAKLDRIVAAASDLFAERDVDEVTTSEIAERADIGAGTLFLYVRTKGDLLLMVQNAHYASALDDGRKYAASISDAVDATVALLRPVVACNRTQVGNGRTYLREMVFGDPDEPHHREALRIVGETEESLAEVLRREGSVTGERAPTLARTVSAALYLAMASGANTAASVDDIMADLRQQVEAVLRC